MNYEEKDEECVASRPASSDTARHFTSDNSFILGVVRLGKIKECTVRERRGEQARSILHDAERKAGRSLLPDRKTRLNP